MLRTGIHICLVLFLSSNGFSQEIRLQHKLHPDKSRMIRLDKPVLVKSFNGSRIQGIAGIGKDSSLRIGGKIIETKELMTIAGFVHRHSGERAGGMGMLIGAGAILPAALYYFLGGIAWGIPNGMFVGSTLLAFDLLLVYAGANLLGIYPRRFSTMNWEIRIIPSSSDQSLPLPRPSG